MAFKSSTILSLPFAFAVVSALVVPDVKPCKDTPTLAVRQPPGFSCEKDCNCEGLTGNDFFQCITNPICEHFCFLDSPSKASRQDGDDAPPADDNEANSPWYNGWQPTNPVSGNALGEPCNDPDCPENNNIPLAPRLSGEFSCEENCNCKALPWPERVKCISQEDCWTKCWNPEPATDSDSEVPLVHREPPKEFSCEKDCDCDSLNGWDYAKCVLNPSCWIHGCFEDVTNSTTTSVAARQPPGFSCEESCDCEGKTGEELFQCITNPLCEHFCFTNNHIVVDVPAENSASEDETTGNI